MNNRIIILLLIVSVAARAQDPQFSQYYEAPLYLNPGFTGITPQQRIALNHRLQWPSLPQAFATYAFSYDIFVDQLASGFGFLVTTDKMGSVVWRTTTAGVLYSYKVRINKDLVFSPGLYFGYGQNGLDRSRLRFEDGLRYERDGVYTSLDPDQDRIGRESYFDVGSGFLVYSKSIWLGAAMQHMNQPNLSVLGDESRLPMKVTFQGGARLGLSAGSRRSPASASPVSYLTPSFIYRVQGKSFSQLDLGINYHVDPVSIGFWYRGLPWSKSVINTVNQDALVVTLGLYFNNFNVGYSYDFTISELQTTSGGAHEVSLVFQFAAPTNRRVRRSMKMLPCPTFHEGSGFWKK